MARLSELVKGTAKALEVKEETVALYARHLREARLISKSGRGTSAAQMTIRDAVNLLLAPMASPEIKDAAECVKRVRGLKFSGHAEGTDVEREGLPDFPWLWRGKKPTQRGENLLLPLGEVLEAMMDSQFMTPYQDTELPVMNFFLTVDRPGSHALLDFDNGIGRWKINFTENLPISKKKQFIKNIPPRPWGMQTKTMVSLDEMLAIIDILEPKQGKNQNA